MLYESRLPSIRARIATPISMDSSEPTSASAGHGRFRGGQGRSSTVQFAERALLGRRVGVADQPGGQIDGQVLERAVGLAHVERVGVRIRSARTCVLNSMFVTISYGCEPAWVSGVPSSFKNETSKLLRPKPGPAVASRPLLSARAGGVADAETEAIEQARLQPFDMRRRPAPGCCPRRFPQRVCWQGTVCAVGAAEPNSSATPYSNWQEVTVAPRGSTVPFSVAVFFVTLARRTGR